MQKRGEWNDQWNQQHTLAAAAPIIVRSYLTHHRSRPSGHTVDHVKLWQQTAGDDCQTQARDGLQGVADLLDYRENLLDPGTTAARQIADWLKHLTEPAATDGQPDAG